jgi:hypothetical protein
LIYCETQGSVTQRLDKITDALLYMLFFTIALFLFQYVTELPIQFFIGPTMAFVYAGIYLLAVYDYRLPCSPNIPNCLFDDMVTYLNDRMFPTCFCTYFSGLSSGDCDAETCFLCSLQTTYKVCTDEVPYLKDMGIFWAPLFYIRKYYSSEYIWFYTTIPFSWILRNYGSVSHLAAQITEDVAVTAIESDCLSLHYGDILISLIVLYFALDALSVIVPLSIRYMSIFLKALIMIVNIVYTMAVSLELSAGDNLKNTIQHD